MSPHLTAPPPAPDTVELVDYKVRCLSSHMGTGATTRVMIEFSSAREPTVAEIAQGIQPKLLTWYVGIQLAFVASLVCVGRCVGPLVRWSKVFHSLTHPSPTTVPLQDHCGGRHQRHLSLAGGAA